ncbi:MAG TPA: DinB family protein, partial [Candidatus Saccharimonadales bacterium]|nr:DinB family protein [Candidatus Saccharimonadales bacterium]
MRELLRYQTWANLKLIDHCATLDPELLKQAIPGTSGSIADMLVHMLEQERWGLSQIGITFGSPTGEGLGRLRTLFEEHGRQWEALLER